MFPLYPLRNPKADDAELKEPEMSKTVRTVTMYQMEDLCACCGERWGLHWGDCCRRSHSTFKLAATMTPTLDKLEAEAALRFPSGSTVLTQGGAIVGRIDPNAAMAERDTRPAFTSEHRRDFDPFADFICTSGGEQPAQSRSFAGLSLDGPGSFIAPRAF